MLRKSDKTLGTALLSEVMKLFKTYLNTQQGCMCDGDSMHRPNLIPYIAHFKLTLSTTAIYVSVDYISLWGLCHLPHSGRNIIPKSDCVQLFSRWQCFLVNTKLFRITAPQPEFFFPCHISSLLPLNLKAHWIRGGTKLYA